MASARSHSLWFALALLSCGSGATGTIVPDVPNTPGTPTNLADTARITVDLGIARQPVVGFGRTLLTLVSPAGDYLAEFRPAALVAAFSSVGISRGLLNIGVVETRSTTAELYAERQNDNSDPRVLDPAGFNFSAIDVLRDKVLTPGAALGFARTEIGPLLDYRFPLDWLRTLRQQNYPLYLDEAAENVLAVNEQFRVVQGAYPPLVHLFNEPTSGNTEIYSSSVQEVLDLVKRVGLRLRATGNLQTRFVVPNEETMSRSLEVARAILADPIARPFVGAIGLHQYPYGSVSVSPRRMLETSGRGLPDPTTRSELEQLRALGAQYGVPLWMTEVSEGPGNADFVYGAFEHVFARVVHIHDTFLCGGVSAYFGMNTFGDSRTQSEHIVGQNPPFRFDQSAIVLINQRERVVRITGVGHAIGHYARWLGAGAVFLESATSAPRVLTSAFRDPANGRIVVVVANADTRPHLLQIRLQGATLLGAVTGETFYGDVPWERFEARAEGDGLVQYVAPPSSVMTLAVPTL